MLTIGVVAWVAGLFGSWIGAELAEDDITPARTPSTLGIVAAAPREQQLPTLDVYAVAATIAPSVVSIHAQVSRDGVLGAGSGSGVVLTADGEILTNAHVVADATTVTVLVPGETEPRPAVLLAIDEVHDLALLRIEADGLRPATFADPADIHVGDAVVSVGYALDLDGDPTVAVGIVSALHRASSDATKALKGLIQTDAAISSGNSGGPLVNALGQVVGITTFIALDQPGVSANGVGFAISNAEALPQIEQLRAAATQAVPPAEAFLGVSLADRIDGGTGALVQEVVAGSAAADAGLQVGDIVLAVDEEDVSGRAALIATIRGHVPQDHITLSVRRDGDDFTLTVTLGTRPTE
ncbi:MAG: trypsin-like peptidase domain-containing protein [Actinomycetota bacterium]|nr:trypsin-like peptidase domain-containing protein [Actinomycetota bacterium]